ncbi:alpha/beta fold hydrolase [Haloarcula salinisoli]|uniref:Alpha/beta hydrolase n=1 Tax=Haloarcula salinisoli TaxID=2487746 RepID=A0A8J7YHD3_9EURY|nr:alpha/beta hydrolase [Halomicroarcula salinisoli]MBX0285039.1 alpha/beta hydrolase [Halomicroarcula salinisoli]MBX0303483.1 alpha/beta hydrolase [Halomicroarcula salinisoli]
MNPPEETTVTVRRDVPFHEVDGETLRLDVYESTATSAPKPAVVLVRGGGFTVGDKGEFARHAIDLAADGYLVVEPQYRLAPEHTFPAALVDVKAAIEWCRTECEQVDPQRIAAVGHSAGANLVVLAAATADDPALEPDMYPGSSSALSAVVGYAGIYDFRMGLDDRRQTYLGGSPEDLPAAYDLASPVEQADMSMPPTLLLHGEDDHVVSPQQSAVLAEALDPLTTVDHRVVPGGHGFPFDGAHYEATSETTADFLATQLASQTDRDPEFTVDDNRNL